MSSSLNEQSPHDGSTLEFEALIVIIGESDSGKSTLMNLIAGKAIQEYTYTCSYQDEDTHRTWNLHLFNVPALRGDFSDINTLEAIEHRLNTMEWKRFTIRGIIYCHNINQRELGVKRAVKPICIFERLRGDRAMENVILCTTQWDMLVDKGVGECTANYLNNNLWREALDLGARLARHDNTRKSVEEILGLIIGKEAVIPLLLGHTKVTKNYERTERLMQEIQSIRIKGATGRAETNRKGMEYCWQQKLADISAELDRVKTVQEKEAIKQKIEKEREDQKCKKNMWDAIQRAREERIEKGTPALCDETSSLGSIDDLSDDTIGDALVSDMKSLERALPGDGIADRQGYWKKFPSFWFDKSKADNSGANRDDFVPLQFKPFTGKSSRYAISHELASTKIQNVRLLLDVLNDIFDTNISISYRGIQRTLEYLINEGHDLGVIYAHLQVIWPKLGVPLISSKPLTDDNPDYIIGSPELAFRKYEDVDELLSFLNMSFDTEIPRSKLGVEHVLRFFVDGGYKFGDICAHMRYTWPRTPKLEWEWFKVWESEEMNLGVWEDFLTLDRRGKEHEDQRQKSLHDDAIHDLYHIKPRRIWDLYAHRIIPFQFSSVNANAENSARSYLHFGPTRLGRYHPVSHSWTEGMSSSTVDSPVNAHEWPIPLPSGVTLEAVRNELLNLRAQYVWLDVVCLRQESPEPNREALRIKEWEIDVPTIGKVYEPSPSVDNVIRYLNGLGKVFRRSGWNDKRHWSQRAWTLQEVSDKYIEAGLPKGVQNLLAETDENGTQLRDHLKIGEIRLDSKAWPTLYNAITAMKGRHSQNPIDKIFGLSALLGCTALPTYSKDEQPEQAWARLLRHVDWRILGELLFACPLPGENGCYWRPSWRQLMGNVATIENVPSLHHSWRVKVEGGRLSCYAALIQGCQVSFDRSSMSTVVIRSEKEGKKYQWTMNKPHAQRIAPGDYTLAAFDDLSPVRWVLCRQYPSGELEKVSVLHQPPGFRDSKDVTLGLRTSYISDLSHSTMVEFC